MGNIIDFVWLTNLHCLQLNIASLKLKMVFSYRIITIQNIQNIHPFCYIIDKDE